MPPREHFPEVWSTVLLPEPHHNIQGAACKPYAASCWAAEEYYQPHHLTGGIQILRQFVTPPPSINVCTSLDRATVMSCLCHLNIVMLNCLLLFMSKVQTTLDDSVSRCFSGFPYSVSVLISTQSKKLSVMKHLCIYISMLPTVWYLVVDLKVCPSTSSQLIAGMRLRLQSTGVGLFLLFFVLCVKICTTRSSPRMLPLYSNFLHEWQTT